MKNHYSVGDITPDELCINFTPTGMIPTKAMTPHVPVTVQEIVDDVLEAVSIGITMAHIHARDEQTGICHLEARNLCTHHRRHPAACT
jgi:uncharacterized protein (DUF849 family)